MIYARVHGRWRPTSMIRSSEMPGGRSVHGMCRPGDLIAYDYRAWRVLDVRRRDEVDWTDREWEYVTDTQASRPYLAVTEDLAPHTVHVRLASSESTATAADGDLHLRACGGGYETWLYLPEHHAVCGSCGDVMPCRELVGEVMGADAIKRMGRFETGGVCPGCEEPVTARQESRTFSENLEVPGGPPVTYHVGRHGCRSSAAAYEKRWVAADPGRRRHALSCPGHVTNHGDGTYECTQLGECPGPLAEHGVYETCATSLMRCAEPACAGGRHGCIPGKKSRLRAHLQGGTTP